MYIVFFITLEVFIDITDLIGTLGTENNIIDEALEVQK
jgi:hypothetical protein